MEKNKTPVVFVLILAGVVAVFGIVAFAIGRVTPTKERMDLKSYYNITSDDEVAIITDDGVEEVNGRIIDGEIFLPYDEVSNDISGSIFYDDVAGTMIVTTPTEKMRFDAANEIRVVDDVRYVALGLVNDYANAEITQLEDPARVVIKTRFKCNAETAVSDAYVRYRAGIKSKVLTEVKKGTQVKVIDVKADGSADSRKVDGWTMIQTDDGFLGYVEDKYLDGKVSVREDEPVVKTGEYTHILRDDKINLVYHQVTSQASNDALMQSLTNVTGINVIAPTWFFLDSTAGDQTAIAAASYVQTAHSLGLQVWAVMNDFDGKVNSPSDTMAALSSDAVREKLVADTIAMTLASGADGINIDYENVSEECAPYFLQFVREMSIGCRNSGLILSICDYVPAYTKYLNRREQARVADYVICMCYDEHRPGSPEAGSVSSISFVKDGIKDTLDEVPPEQTIVAIPFFTRLWMTTSEEAPASNVFGMGDAWNWVTETGLEVNWDNEAAQNYVEMQDDVTYYQMWLEDAASVEEKVKLIGENGCAGVAEWKLGLETSDVWAVIADNLAG